MNQGLGNKCVKLLSDPAEEQPWLELAGIYQGHLGGRGNGANFRRRHPVAIDIDFCRETGLLWSVSLRTFTFLLVVAFYTNKKLCWRVKRNRNANRKGSRKKKPTWSQSTFFFLHHSTTVISLKECTIETNNWKKNDSCRWTHYSIFPL